MNHRKKILIFIDWYIPGVNAGGPIRSVVNMVENLKDIYDFSIITSDTDLGSTIPYPDIISNQWIEFNSYKIFYLSSAKTKFSVIKKLILNSKPDLIQINGIFSWYFSLVPLLTAKYFNRIPVVVSVRGMLHSSALSVKKWKKLIFIAFSRGFGLFNGIDLHATDENEKKEIIKNLGMGYSIVLGPNFPAKVKDYNFLPEKFKKANSLKLIWIARLSEEKNPFFLIDTLMDVKVDISIELYGLAFDKNYEKRLLEFAKRLPDNIDIIFNGNIEHQDIPKVLNKADVFILPTKGENFGHAIFEALSHGVPVIIGNNTPWKNLQIQIAGFDLELKHKLFIDALLFFHNMNSIQFNEWRFGAHQLALNYTENTNIRARYTDIFGLSE